MGKTEGAVRFAAVTGASSGIGRETAAALAARGWRVFDLSRRETPERAGVRRLFCDVTDPASVDAALRALAGETGGRLDLLVNNAGAGVSGAVEFLSPEECARQFSVNYFGVETVTRAALPLLRASRGRIVNVSSVAALAPIPFQADYSASKAAVNALTRALRGELRSSGVSVCAVMPGDVRTGFTDAREKNGEGAAVYGEAIGRAVSQMERDERGGMDPARAGRFIARLAERRRVKPLYAIGFSYKAVCLLLKLLPSGLSSALIERIYHVR